MRKYISPITATLTPDNWEEKINLKDMSLDEMSELLWDLKKMESLGKKLGGYMKEACTARIPEGMMEHVGPRVGFVLNDRERAGSLDREKCIEEMGIVWVTGHSKPATEYVELRISLVKPE